MRESDGEPNNTTGLSWVEAKDIPSARSARPKRSLPLGAFPSLIATRIAPSALHHNYILITPARRFRHGRGSLGCCGLRWQAYLHFARHLAAESAGGSVSRHSA
jgi:hypothetical protein